MTDISSVATRKAFVHDMLESVEPKYFPLEGTNYTVCVATFKDGWSTLGYSVCVNKADYDPSIGQAIALENAIADAKTHYWRTVGYLAHRGIGEI